MNKMVWFPNSVDIGQATKNGCLRYNKPVRYAAPQLSFIAINLISSCSSGNANEIINEIMNENLRTGIPER